MFKCLRQCAKSLNYCLTQTETTAANFCLCHFFVVNTKNGNYKSIKIYKHLILIWIKLKHYICSFFPYTITTFPSFIKDTCSLPLSAVQFKDALNL